MASQSTPCCSCLYALRATALPQPIMNTLDYLLPQPVEDLLAAACQRAFAAAISLVELNLVPDFLIRRGIRFLLSRRLAEVLCR